jgi:hypothetical protein
MTRVHRNHLAAPGLNHLNEITAWWLANVSDVRQHRTTGKPPLELHQHELPYLIPLPDKIYDTAKVLYRTVNSEGYVSYLQNFYSVPWQRIGQLLPVRITSNELIVYGPEIAEIARHELLAAGETGEQRTNKSHRPGPDLRRKHELLRQRFEQLGRESAVFFDQLVRTRRYGKDEAQRILGLLATYRQEDLRLALERASRYRAFSLSAVERILAALAEPRPALESVDDQARQHLDELLRQDPVPPRSTADYQQLLDSENDLPSWDDQKTKKRNQPRRRSAINAWAILKSCESRSRRRLWTPFSSEPTRKRWHISTSWICYWVSRRRPAVNDPSNTVSAKPGSRNEKR